MGREVCWGRALHLPDKMSRQRRSQYWGPDWGRGAQLKKPALGLVHPGSLVPPCVSQTLGVPPGAIPGRVLAPFP